MVVLTVHIDLKQNKEKIIIESDKVSIFFMDLKLQFEVIH